MSGVGTVAIMYPSVQCLSGTAFDLATTDDQGRPWDVNDGETRARAWQVLEREQPTVVIGIPMCAAVCSWQVLNAAMLHRIK